MKKGYTAMHGYEEEGVNIEHQEDRNRAGIGYGIEGST